MNVEIIGMHHLCPPPLYDNKEQTYLALSRVKIMHPHYACSLCRQPLQGSYCRIRYVDKHPVSPSWRDHIAMKNIIETGDNIEFLCDLSFAAHHTSHITQVVIVDCEGSNYS